MKWMRPAQLVKMKFMRPAHLLKIKLMIPVHLPWPVSQCPHQWRPVRQGQSLARTAQSSSWPRAACGPKVHDSNRWKQMQLTQVTPLPVALSLFYLRFRCVEGIRGVSYVLRAVEHTKGQAREKVTWGKVTGHRTQLKACFALQITAHILQLRHIVLAIATKLDQLRPVLHILWHSVQQIQTMQLHENGAPER